MTLIALHVIAVLTLGSVHAHGGERTVAQSGGATSGAPATPRSMYDSQAVAQRRAESESALVRRRRLVDSIAAAGGAKRSRSRHDGPLDEYTWPLYGNVLGGAIMGLAAFLVRHRDASPGARRLWGVVGVMLGTMAGGISFMTVFMFFTIMSVGFSQLPPAMMFALGLLGTAFAIAWVMSLRYRRLR